MISRVKFKCVYSSYNYQLKLIDIHKYNNRPRKDFLVSEKCVNKNIFHKAISTKIVNYKFIFI